MLRSSGRRIFVTIFIFGGVSIRFFFKAFRIFCPGYGYLVQGHWSTFLELCGQGFEAEQAMFNSSHCETWAAVDQAPEMRRLTLCAKLSLPRERWCKKKVTRRWKMMERGRVVAQPRRCPDHGPSSRLLITVLCSCVQIHSRLAPYLCKG